MEYVMLRNRIAEVKTKFLHTLTTNGFLIRQLAYGQGERRKPLRRSFVLLSPVSALLSPFFFL